MLRPAPIARLKGYKLSVDGYTPSASICKYCAQYRVCSPLLSDQWVLVPRSTFVKTVDMSLWHVRRFLKGLLKYLAACCYPLAVTLLYVLMPPTFCTNCRLIPGSSSWSIMYMNSSSVCNISCIYYQGANSWQCCSIAIASSEFSCSLEDDTRDLQNEATQIKETHNACRTKWCFQLSALERL